MYVFCCFIVFAFHLQPGYDDDDDDHDHDDDDDDDADEGSVTPQIRFQSGNTY